MAPSKTKPAPLRTGTGSGLHCLAADAVRIDTAAFVNFQIQTAGRRAVAEAVACGARFILTGRDFLWESTPGADRSRIREIISDAKTESVRWRAFCAAVAETARGAP